MLVDSLESFKVFVESRLPERFGKVTSTGSGVIIDHDLVLTAAHVIDESEIQKVVIGKEIYRAKVLKRFSASDVAILRVISKKPLPFMKLGIPEPILLGDFNFTVGFPALELFGTNPKFYRSFISGLEGAGGDPEMFQICADACSGMSGGAVFQLNGIINGLISEGYTGKTESIHNFVFATKIAPILKDIQSYLSYKIEKSSNSDFRSDRKIFQKAIEASVIVLNCPK